MKLSERDLLFPDRRTKKVYKCINKSNLSSGLCVVYPESDIAEYMSIFPKDRYNTSIFKKDQCTLDTLIIEKPIKYKLYNLEELLFLLKYEETDGKLTLENLVKISEGYKYSTFILDTTSFIELLNDLDNFKHNYAFNGVVSSLCKQLDPAHTYFYAVSLYDINSVLTNIYNEPFVGLCVSFEVLVERAIVALQRRHVQCQVSCVYTNNYDGIFYKDGEVACFEQTYVDAFRYVSFFNDIIKKYTELRKNINVEKVAADFKEHDFKIDYAAMEFMQVKAATPTKKDMPAAVIKQYEKVKSHVSKKIASATSKKLKYEQLYVDPTMDVNTEDFEAKPIATPAQNPYEYEFDECSYDDYMQDAPKLTEVQFKMPEENIVEDFFDEEEQKPKKHTKLSAAVINEVKPKSSNSVYTYANYYTLSSNTSTTTIN